MLLRHYSHAFGLCRDEHDDLRSPRRKSRAPPVDICCAVFDSPEAVAAQPLCDKVSCGPVYLKTHKVEA